MSPLFRTLIFTIVVPGFWTVAMPYWMLPRCARLELSLTSVPGLLLMAAGGTLYVVTAFWGFALQGRGTPAPIDPPKELVVGGPYRVVRNPMYWAVAAVIMGEALVFHSLALAEMAIGLFAAAMLFVFLYEEPALRRKFGAEYEAYCRRVPRWIPAFRNRLS